MDTDETPRRSRTAARLSLTVLAMCALAVAGMYVEGGRTRYGVILAGGLPVTLLVALCAAAVGGWHRSRLRLGLVLAILVSQAPLLDHVVPDRSDVDPSAPTIRVTTLNTMWAGPTDAELVDLAEEVDVLALQEWNPQRTEGLARALGDDWRLADSDRDDYIRADVDVWVRREWTIESSDPLVGRPPGSSLRLRRGDAVVTVMGTRLQNPAFFASSLWAEGLDSLRRATDAADGPVIVLGDLNAPPSAVAYRRFAWDTGLRDCTAQLGLGFPGTWGRTAGASFAPVPIDHVLTRDARCTDLTITRERGSDHRALTATVSLG